MTSSTAARATTCSTAVRGTTTWRAVPASDAVLFPEGEPVTVTLDDLADDGPQGGHDNVHTDVEDVYGAGGNDVLSGSAAANTLDGGGGDDTLTGWSGEDSLYGGPGNDLIYARDGEPDLADCGEGFDTAVVDERDRTAGCEIVDRRPAVPRVDFVLSYQWAWTARDTAAQRLHLHDLAPRRADITIGCDGRGCPVALRRPRRAQARDLMPFVRGRRFAPGSALEIRATYGDYVGRLERFTFRRGSPPALIVRCTSPGARHVVRCPGTAH